MANIAYQGPSMLDGRPIIALLTGVDNPSRNPKTGPMIQLWILRDDVDPLTAVKTGADASICGDCKLRGDHGKTRSCYVTLFQAPQKVYHHKDTATPIKLSKLRHRSLRLGAYGDPAALPFELVKSLAEASAAWTGYTHQWRTCDQRLSHYVMASCDSEQDRAEAKALGWKTFRIKQTDRPRLAGEALCPASDEAGKKLQCITCNRCDGRHKDIVINVHGSGKRHFK